MFEITNDNGEGDSVQVDRQFAAAEQHLLASGKRDSANLLADLLFEWQVMLYRPYHHHQLNRPPLTVYLLVLL
jgi:hypothetical protein